MPDTYTLRTRQDMIDYCRTYPGAFEDYPFTDPNWTVMRRLDNKKGFAWIFERNGHIWINVKLDPEWGRLIQSAYEAVLPAYHMNKVHWTSVILNGTVPDEQIKALIDESFRLCGKKQ